MSLNNLRAVVFLLSLCFSFSAFSQVRPSVSTPAVRPSVARPAAQSAKPSVAKPAKPAATKPSAKTPPKPKAPTKEEMEKARIFTSWEWVLNPLSYLAQTLKTADPTQIRVISAPKGLHPWDMIQEKVDQFQKRGAKSASEVESLKKELSPYFLNPKEVSVSVLKEKLTQCKISPLDLNLFPLPEGTKKMVDEVYAFVDPEFPMFSLMGFKGDQVILRTMTIPEFEKENGKLVISSPAPLVDFSYYLKKMFLEWKMCPKVRGEINK